MGRSFWKAPLRLSKQNTASVDDCSNRTSKGCARLPLNPVTWLLQCLHVVRLLCFLWCSFSPRINPLGAEASVFVRHLRVPWIPRVGETNNNYFWCINLQQSGPYPAPLLGQARCRWSIGPCTRRSGSLMQWRLYDEQIYQRKYYQGYHYGFSRSGNSIILCVYMCICCRGCVLPLLHYSYSMHPDFLMSDADKPETMMMMLNTE